MFVPLASNGRIYSDDHVKDFRSNHVNEQPIRKRCTECGRKIGGPNHKNDNGRCRNQLLNKK